MLTIPTYVGPSNLHGLGVFSKAQIAEGEVIWRHHPMIDLSFNDEQWRKMREAIHSESYQTLNGLVAKAENKIHLSIDNAQYMNHSIEEANVGFRDREKEVMIALKEISVDEELLCDYREYSDPDCPTLSQVLSDPKSSTD